MNLSSVLCRSWNQRLAPVWVGLVASVLAGCASGEKLVTVRSVVDSTYATQRSQLGAPTQTFVMAKGRMLAPALYEQELSDLGFGVVARTFAGDLERAGYKPATDARTADMVIVVHWGVTSGVERAADQLVYDPDVLRQAQEAVVTAREVAASDTRAQRVTDSATAVAAAEAAFRAEANHAATLYAGNDLQASSNADLLGFRDVLAAEDRALAPTDVGETLREMADEDRYFAVLIAYDAKASLTGQRRRLWTTRVSIASTGQNFKTGLDRMSDTAAAVHGKPQPGILITSSRARAIPAILPDVTIIEPRPLPAAPKR